MPAQQQQKATHQHCKRHLARLHQLQLLQQACHPLVLHPHLPSTTLLLMQL
jgi:hypothetical protein